MIDITTATFAITNFSMVTWTAPTELIIKGVSRSYTTCTSTAPIITAKKSIPFEIYGIKFNGDLSFWGAPFRFYIHDTDHVKKIYFKPTVATEGLTSAYGVISKSNLQSGINNTGYTSGSATNVNALFSQLPPLGKTANENVVYIEGCTFTETVYAYITDGGQGARTVVRFNDVTLDTTGSSNLKYFATHATQNTPVFHRGAQMSEFYNNKMTNATTTSAASFMLRARAGTGVIHHNSLGSTYTSYIMSVDSERGSAAKTEATTDHLFGPCDGSSDYDGNETIDHTRPEITSFFGNTTFTGKHTGANNASVLTDEGEVGVRDNKAWNTNKLAYSLADTSPGTTVYNITDGSMCLIASNTANTITCTLFGGTENDWDTGDEYRISDGYPCRDQIGRGYDTDLFSVNFDLLGGEGGFYQKVANWTLGVGWAKTDFTLVKSAGATGTVSYDLLAPEVGKTYAVRYKVSSWSAGANRSLTPSLGGATAPSWCIATDDNSLTHSLIHCEFKAVSTAGLVFTPTGSDAENVACILGPVSVAHVLTPNAAQTRVPMYMWGNTLGGASGNRIKIFGDAGIRTILPNRDYYTQEGASCTALDTCTSGVGYGTATPTSGVTACTTANTAWWSTTSNKLYRCVSDKWTEYYEPEACPHPLTGYSAGCVYTAGQEGVTGYITGGSDPPVYYLLQVTKSGTGTGTVTSTLSEINCGATCGFNFLSGASTTLTATPASGNSHGAWTGACAGTADADPCTVSMSEARTVDKEFIVTPTEYPLIITNVGLGVTDPVAGTYGRTSGTAVTVTQTPGDNHTFAGWSGGVCSGTGACSFNKAASSETVTATWTENTKYKLTVTYPTDGSVVASDIQGIRCGGDEFDCEYDYYSTETPTLSTLCAAGYYNATYSGDCSGASCGPLDMSADKEVSVACDPLLVTPSVVGGLGGTISPAQLATFGSPTTFLIAPNDGWKYKTEAGTCGGSITDTQIVNGRPIYTFTTSAINAPCSVEPEFETIKLILTQ
jgi:hypothetical protein